MKTSEANIEDLKGMVVSDGTMRPEDLIPKFLNVLKVYGKDVYDKYVGENPEVLDLSGMDDETMGWVVDELFDKLNEIAPEGYSFGSQDGDGACYGFWSVDADERKKCEDVPEIKVGDFVEYDKNGKEDWNWAEVTGVNEDGTLNLHITDLDKTNYDDVDHVPVASCSKLPRFAGMTDTGHYYMDGPINLYKGGWEICVTKKDLDPSKYEFIGTIDSYEDMPQVAAYYDDNYVYDEDDESEVREYFGVDFPEGAVTFADFKEDVVGESCVKADGRSAESKKCEAYIQPVTLYSTTRYDDAEAVQSFLRDIGGDAVTVDKQRNGDVLSVNVSGSDDDVEAFVDTYKNEYGSIVKDCEVDATGWTAPEDIYYIATEQGRKELRGESKKGESAGETMRVDVYADRRNFDPQEFVKYVRKAGGKNGGYISVDSVVSVDVLNKANRLAQANDYKRTESKKSEDHRRKDRYGHSVRRFTAKDLSVTPDIKITKIIPPTMDDMEKCNMSRNGKLSVLFSVDGENFKLNYNPTISGYNGMSALAREKCSITNLDTGTVYDCTGAYSIPWLDNPENKFIYHQRLEPVVQAYMNPTEQMVLTQFIKPFAKDYLGIDATESKKQEADGGKDIFILDLTRIDAEGDEEGLDDMQAAKNFYDVDEAIQAAKELADSYKDVNDVVQVTVMAGEQEKPNGDIVGEPFDIFTASSSDSATTAKYREKAGYTKTDGLDYYAKGGKSEAKKSETKEDKPVWGVTVEYTPVNGETRRTDVAPSCSTEERAKEAAIARVTKDYGPLKDVTVIRVDRLPEWAARNIRDLVRNNKTESMGNRIENTTITEQEFSDILNAYVKEVEGGDIKPIRIEVLKTEPVEGDGTLIKLHYDARENGWSNARTYALVFGDLHKNRDNDLIYVLHDWQSGEKVTPEDIADHDWELVNNHIRPSEILDATKSSESLDPSIDVKGRGVVELIEDDYLKLSRDINSRGYCKDKDGGYNVWIGGSFKGKFPSVEAAADAGYTLVEGKRCEAQVSEKTFKQGVDEFIGAAPEGGWSDYWAMQQDWEFYKDSLCRDGVITQKQADSWSNPCTPDTFDRWQKRNGLVHRGYESKKSEARPTKQEAQIKELCKLCRNDKNVAESVFKALTKDYNTSLDPVLAGQYLTATWKSKLEELGGCNGWYDGFKKLYAAMGSDFVCSVLQDLKLGSSGIGCGACITIVNNIYDKVVKRNEANKSEGDDEEAFGKFEDAVKSILMDKYGVVDSHGPSDETANSLVLQYGATLRDAFDKGGENGYDPTSVALLIITRQLREAPQFFDDCKDFTFNKNPKKSESVDDLLARHNQKWLVKVSYDVDGTHSAVAPSIVRADTKDAATEIALKRHKGLGYNMKVVSAEPLNENFKKSESYQDWIAFYFCVDNRGDEYAVYPHDVHDRNGVKVVGLQSQYSPIGSHEAYKKDYILDVMKPIPLDEVENSAIYKKLADGEDRDIIALDKKDAERIMNASNPLSELNKVVQEYDIYKGEGIANVKKSESLTLKQKELKDMVRYGEAEDITTISDAEAKELKKKGIETVGISRGVYGMNGALLRDSEGKKYVITARSSNLFYFV